MTFKNFGVLRFIQFLAVSSLGVHSRIEDEFLVSSNYKPRTYDLKYSRQILLVCTSTIRSMNSRSMELSAAIISVDRITHQN